MVSRRFRLPCAAVAAVALLGLAVPAPAEAAAGVRGGLGTVTMTGGASDSCLEACYDYTFSYIHVAGWAYNHNTKPAQEVRVVVTGPEFKANKSYPQGTDYFNTVFTSPTKPATGKRADVEHKYHLPTSKVGFDLRARTYFHGDGHYDNIQAEKIKVCVQARDEGSKQTWRSIGCRYVHANNKAINERRDG